MKIFKTTYIAAHYVSNVPTPLLATLLSVDFDIHQNSELVFMLFYEMMLLLM